MKIKVSELIVRYLERLGIKHIFGIPGAHILPVYDALYAADIETILTKHEQGAAFMAAGYTRASGRIGACISTAGPGATNLITGVASAYADKQPMLVITGETSTHIYGKGGLQESSGEGGSIDQVMLFKGITRYNKIIERTDYLPQVLTQITKILLAPNSGPVLLSLPFNVQQELVDASILDGIKTERHTHTIRSNSSTIDALVEMIVQAQRPVILAGFGCIRSGAQQVLARLSETLNIPVATSLKAKGVIDERAPLSLGSLGVTSSGEAHEYIVERADLILVLGAGFNERTSYVWEPSLLQSRRVLQIDNDQEQLEKVFDADIAFCGDIRETLDGILGYLERHGIEHSSASGPQAEIAELKASGGAKRILQTGFELVEAFFAQLERHFPRDAVVFDDNIIYAQNLFHVAAGNHYHPNSGISSLGHAVPAAIGARFALELPTFAVLGDGGFQMCAMELMTAVNYRKQLNVVVFNNSSMGLIRKNQVQQYDGRLISCDFVNPDYAYLAKAFGIAYYRVAREADLESLFAQADLHNGINLIELLIDKNAFPNYRSRR
ncbi:thiamine pyrophosphate-binding protein [endosymbiont of Ridgeia piscesae]|jgi:acetolactate synthase-1/2/3 large subunit|uniref:Acetolactate synthase-1/2/3 large subunit n=1 Tax=endosymbiont of Ridgeia piscesae TaxID=54398 RepID=A0A0T5Z9U3_9GAMM|nr:thiamine pyrophosphate-binding protein [endosymbiont of Ridgeia piscesae]KRT59551.1 acetolactate synthase-1/2/3 large subunit [endosymbiont of Ridgeia piscesae]